MALPERRPDRQQHPPAESGSNWHAFYDIENPIDVDAYVTEHPSVLPVLAEAPGQIRAVFGDTGSPKLELQWDPEEGHCWLTVGIPSDIVDETVLPMLYEFEDRWWLNRMTSTDATLVFDVAER